MKSKKKRELDALIRNLPTSFIEKALQVVAPGMKYQHNWHIDLIADRLKQCFNGKTTRLIITLPPRYLKSICVSVAYPAWVLGRDPSKSIIVASYSAELAAKHARDTLAIMQSSWYKRIFPKTQLLRQAEHDIVTTKNGGRYATSIGGTLTGRGGDILIIDDPIKPDDALSETARKKAKEWFDGTLFSRLNDKDKGVIIIIMQRLHVDDLIAHVMAKGEWETVNLPAIAEIDEHFTLSDGREFTRNMGEVLHPERESLKTLQKIKQQIGTYNYSSQYQQQPVPMSGNMIKWDWFRFYEESFRLDRADVIVQSWDTASKTTESANFSVCVTILVRGETYYLIDIYRNKLDFPDLYKAVIAQARKYRPRRILIEDAASGTPLIQQLTRYPQPGVTSPNAITPVGDKITRMAGASLAIEQGRIFLPRYADWLTDFYEEVRTFPFGAHNDQVDALSQYIHWEETRNRVRIMRVAL